MAKPQNCHWSKNFSVTTSCKRILGFVQESKQNFRCHYKNRHSIGISQQYTLGIWKLSLFFTKSRVQELQQRFLTSTKCLSRWSDSNLTLVLRQKSFRQRIFHFVNRTRAKKKRKNLSFSKFSNKLLTLYVSLSTLTLPYYSFCYTTPKMALLLLCSSHFDQPQSLSFVPPFFLLIS